MPLTHTERAILKLAQKRAKFKVVDDVSDIRMTQLEYNKYASFQQRNYFLTETGHMLRAQAVYTRCFRVYVCDKLDSWPEYIISTDKPVVSIITPDLHQHDSCRY